MKDYDMDTMVSELTEVRRFSQESTVALKQTFEIERRTWENEREHYLEEIAMLRGVISQKTGYRISDRPWLPR